MLLLLTKYVVKLEEAAQMYVSLNVYDSIHKAQKQHSLSLSPTPSPPLRQINVLSIYLALGAHRKDAHTHKLLNYP